MTTVVKRLRPSILRVLGIETSCDETGIAIYDSENDSVVQTLFSQIELHAPFGGVVPELASRDHIRKIIPLIRAALDKAGISPPSINGIAYTKGPGLMGALLVGATMAKTLGFALDIPTLGVHHLEAHLLAPFLSADKPQFPFLALLVSGGHTMLIEAKALGHYQILGDTLDDAAGEAFDKVAKLLGLPYPGGPALAKLATQGVPNRFHFPRPMINRPELNFSFSGLKTHTLGVFKKTHQDEKIKADIAHAFQEAVVDTLAIKCERALKKTGLKQLVVAGGVSANIRLREKLHSITKPLNTQLFFPPLDLCTDNGAMIAYAGYLRLSKGEHDPDLAIQTVARWPIDTLR